MRYDEARALIRSGDLIAFRGEGWLSRLIRAATGGSWSHVGVAWCFRDRVFILEARETQGVTIRALSEVGRFDWISTAPIAWTDRAETAALADLGRSYSYADAALVGIGLSPATHGEICSEYASKVLHQMEMAPLPSNLSPSSLVSELLDRGFLVRSVEPQA